jgi:hypothetical protein
MWWWYGPTGATMTWPPVDPLLVAAAPVPVGGIVVCATMGMGATATWRRGMKIDGHSSSVIWSSLWEYGGMLKVTPLASSLILSFIFCIQLREHPPCISGSTGMYG